MGSSNEYMRNYMIRRYRTRRKMMFDYLGSVCYRCGSQDGLEIDHIDPKVKSFTLCGRAWNKPWKEITAELDKCQLLCDSCHKAKTRIDLTGRPAWNKGKTHLEDSRIASGPRADPPMAEEVREKIRKSILAIYADPVRGPKMYEALRRKRGPRNNPSS